MQAWNSRLRESWDVASDVSFFSAVPMLNKFVTHLEVEVEEDLRHEVEWKQERLIRDSKSFKLSSAARRLLLSV